MEKSVIHVLFFCILLFLENAHLSFAQSNFADTVKIFAQRPFTPEEAIERRRIPLYDTLATETDLVHYVINYLIRQDSTSDGKKVEGILYSKVKNVRIDKNIFEKYKDLIIVNNSIRQLIRIIRKTTVAGQVGGFASIDIYYDKTGPELRVGYYAASLNSRKLMLAISGGIEFRLLKREEVKRRWVVLDALHYGI